MKPHDLSRREALKYAGLGIAAATLGPGAVHTLAAAARPARSRALRIAHLTDIHVEPERRAGEGMAAAFTHANTLPDKPDLIVTGGDHVYDSFEHDEARTKTQWDVFTRALADSNKLPILSCLGNHDCWGWNKSRSKTTGDEPLWGKKLAIDHLKMPGRYHSADKNGWHLVFLDSITAEGDGYIGRLDDEQFEWLKGDLSATKLPVLIVSHIPILSVCALEWGKDDKPKATLEASRMHTDAGRLRSLFLKHPNVKVCVSGHIHLLDRCEYDGVTYLCNGAVSGNWWKGRHQQCDEGYAILDLYDDGAFESKYQTYGWKAAGEK